MNTRRGVEGPSQVRGLRAGALDHERHSIGPAKVERTSLWPGMG